MNIYNIKESSLNETSGISLNIYLSGCKGYCEGCHSDHTWDFNSGSELILCDLIDHLYTVKDFTFDHICILGGEPLDQPVFDLINLCKALKETFESKPLWLYTHFELDEISENLLECGYVDFIKTGKYEKDLPEAEEQYGVFLASNNQVIHKLR
ncbi:MAG: 4Fe-4S cluster-binding domain-containing protein [Candidatus Woesearchaeota archaeon]|jgi:anaerobic ribonucleoside-triphosphate reductase activating protein|nr:4Fe-4S cluster-binding domain-containing protein [Candidatus Woesearchaeota archaeon]